MTKMTPQPAASSALARHNLAPVASSARFAQTDRRPRRAQHLTRHYEVVYLRSNGDIDEIIRVAPALPAFEDSFAALARGALLKTERGEVAIEDILPGDRVKTVTSGFQTVLWRGGMSIVPGVQGVPSGGSDANVLKATGRGAQVGKLVRISADALGVGRPMSDLLLGPSARLYQRSPALERVTGDEAAFVPVQDFVDGVNIVEVTPQSAVQVFQIGFARHERIAVNGVELDSHNPGARHELGLSGDMLDLYLDLFPHMTRIEDFGHLMHPRLSLHDLDFGVVA